MKKTTILLCLPALILLTEPAAAAEARPCTARSGPGTVALLELYTSEGCSSCPPAERWLNSLAPGGLAPGRVVPLALHVDYWNHLGWRDPFSQQRFTARQVAYKTRADARSVYTPQMFFNGREYLGWYRREDLARTLETVNRQAERASIRVHIAKPDHRSIDIKTDVVLREKGAHDRMEAYLVLYENRLATRVSAGENRGEHLQHDHVVRHLQGPLALKPDGRLTVAHRFPIGAGWKPADLGVAVFVQDRANGEVWQTLALANCR
ncbi:MAG: DUF1223 domain-containing protein [Pseudomonadota bacterium]